MRGNITTLLKISIIYGICVFLLSCSDTRDLNTEATSKDKDKVEKSSDENGLGDRKVPDPIESSGMNATVDRSNQSEASTDSYTIGTFTLIDSIPHSVASFTQGLTYYNGKLIETTGLTGLSEINIIEPESGDIVKSKNLPLFIFGEGNTIINDTLYIITYKNQVLYKYSYPDLEVISELSYAGEGWGLTYLGQDILFSDGSSILKVRSKSDFRVKSNISVTLNGTSVFGLNELETVGEAVYSNIWGEDRIIKIDIASGNVKTVFDFSSLRLGQTNNRYAEVLNGIAYNAKDDIFYITGKNWNHIYKVRFNG
jgi:glutamine cyclotransferase